MSGNETTGLQRWLREQCNELVGVRMAGVASSLNVACATTLSLYEAVRQRHS